MFGVHVEILLLSGGLVVECVCCESLVVEDVCCEVSQNKREPLFSGRPTNGAKVVLKEGWSLVRGLFYMAL